MPRRCKVSAFFIFILGEWVIVNANCRHVFESNGGSGKNYFTVLIAINAGGFVLPPFVIYGAQHLMDSWCHGGPPGTSYGITDKVRLLLQTDTLMFSIILILLLVYLVFRRVG
jgi:hypothetical protein